MTVEDARAAMLDGAGVLGREEVALDDAVGRVLAERVLATRDQPPFDASAMDGWAVRAADLPAPEGLAIVGEATAGRGLPRALGPGEAARISTGAPVPDGADRVVIQEEAERREDRVRIPPADGGNWIRPRGGDFRAGDALLGPG
ncbi:MAG: Molybdopterin molybdenumtransferase, partial [uncultured Sphingomonadaceae bacterium]